MEMIIFFSFKLNKLVVNQIIGIKYTTTSPRYSNGVYEYELAVHQIGLQVYCINLMRDLLAYFEPHVVKACSIISRKFSHEYDHVMCENRWSLCTGQNKDGLLIISTFRTKCCRSWRGMCIFPQSNDYDARSASSRLVFHCFTRHTHHLHMHTEDYMGKQLSDIHLQQQYTLIETDFRKMISGHHHRHEHWGR
jgi:hypothetical protein